MPEMGYNRMGLLSADGRAGLPVLGSVRRSIMSATTGDKSRFHRLRKAKVARRKKMAELRQELAKQPAAKA
jgi:hypothetical protein